MRWTVEKERGGRPTNCVSLAVSWINSTRYAGDLYRNEGNQRWRSRSDLQETPRRAATSLAFARVTRFETMFDLKRYLQHSSNKISTTRTVDSE